MVLFYRQEIKLIQNDNYSFIQQIKRINDK